MTGGGARKGCLSLLIEEHERKSYAPITLLTVSKSRILPII
jgi:hypothetical protein